MDKDGTNSSTGMEKFAIDIGIALAEASSFFRAAGEWMGILKIKPLGEKKPGNRMNGPDAPIDLARADLDGWDGAALRKAAIPAIIIYAQIAQKMERGIRNLDRLVGIEPQEKGRRRLRAAIIALIAVPIAIIAFNIWSFANNAKPAQEKKPQEKTAPAPRKATGREMHKNDAFYRMAFSRPLPKSTFAVAVQQPMKKQAASRHS